MNEYGKVFEATLLLDVFMDKCVHSDQDGYLLFEKLAVYLVNPSGPKLILVYLNFGVIQMTNCMKGEKGLGRGTGGQ